MRTYSQRHTNHVNFKPSLSLKDKKDCSNHKLEAAIEMLHEIHPNLHKFVVRQLIIENMQMLISSCEQTREFLVKHISIKWAMKIDSEVVTMPTLSNMKEGASLLMYNLGFNKDAYHWTKTSPKVHDALFHTLYLLNKNLEILLVLQQTIQCQCCFVTHPMVLPFIMECMSCWKNLTTFL